MRTRRVRIGLAAATLPFHDPIRLAEELAIVDILSEGRLDVGRGARQPPSAACPCSTPCCVDRSSSSPRARDTYVKACEKAGRSAAEIASLLGRWGVSRHVYVAATDAEALAEAKEAEACGVFSSPSGSIACTRCCSRGSGRWRSDSRRSRGSVGRGERRLRLPRHRRRAGRRAPASGGRRNALLDELRRSASGARAALDGALRPRGHAAVPLRRGRPLTSAGPAPCRSPS